MAKIIQGDLTGKGLKLGIVAARFNDFITSRLLDGALDALQPGETMRFCNDHDPLPLLAQLQARYGDSLNIEYKQREPCAIVIDFAVLA
mgnify:CR=1 FL=1